VRNREAVASDVEAKTLILHGASQSADDRILFQHHALHTQVRQLVRRCHPDAMVVPPDQLQG
jgi:LmbE family N-acetylglucosaminyl deacetylase